ncbi:MAG: MBOAT family protein [Lachnospiraceae bacterium]|jgi:D-alanyl-lipoteichoic acid acyltransferase DltB (MBOAT superfamily)|nr:MBOAT family protein [Lachnospiraceae bacterium]MCH4028502.1 MBOAT family protein [Lachnospiraceae bacterium]MCH4066352.1 MBOAT family protein [Lachnospiraceae bacterium]MCH4112382.1 MBOAT family protein [Lachnospiraceae bacterium]MCI1353648.1 MBOAT family protein [Lachnospiraceae bacterium]
MEYNKPLYLCAFLPMAALIYHYAPQKRKRIVLLLADLIFYTLLAGKLTAVFLLTCLFTWWMERRIGSASGRGKTAWFLAGIIVLFGTLFAFRFLRLFPKSPTGISYYTLMAAACLIEVFWGRLSPMGLCDTFLFLAFFPQVLQGPIVRPQDTLEQMKNPSAVRRSDIRAGLLRILWGLFKKLAIADRLNMVVGMLFREYTNYHGAWIPFAAVCCTLQLYMDFSGMIDVTIGSAQLFGITLPENFRQPFLSEDAGEFWRRWHITLGVWLKTYVYYPIVTSKRVLRMMKSAKKKHGKYAAQLLVSFLALTPVWLFNGVWHGPHLNYILYGVYYLVMILLNEALKPVKTAFYRRTGFRREGAFFKVFRIVRTLIIVVTGELFFRAKGTRAGLFMIAQTFRDFDLSELTLTNLHTFGLDTADYAVILFGTILVFAYDLMREHGFDVNTWLSGKKRAVRWALYYAAVALVLVFGAYGTGYLAVDMIYANF